MSNEKLYRVIARQHSFSLISLHFPHTTSLISQCHTFYSFYIKGINLRIDLFAILSVMYTRIQLSLSLPLDLVCFTNHHFNQIFLEQNCLTWKRRNIVMYDFFFISNKAQILMHQSGLRKIGCPIKDYFFRTSALFRGVGVKNPENLPTSLMEGP